MAKVTNPLSESRPSEVPLKSAPLIRVLYQMRFPMIAAVEEKSFIVRFQESLRGEYPVMRQERGTRLSMALQGAISGPESTVWRFHDVAGNWRASLASDFIALETTAYTDQADFLARLGRLLNAAREHVNPQMTDRCGLRYIDRVTGERLKRLGTMLRPEVAGILNAPFWDKAVHMVSQNIFALPDNPGKLMARWALVPENATIDPTAIEPISERSWILDIDVFDEQSRPYDPDQVIGQAQKFADRAYTFFRWAVNDEFIREFGGGK
jgi:uncharacterized protein (TIGR04255 family)